MLTTVLVALLGAITIVNGHQHEACPNSTETPVTIEPNPIPTCGAVDTSVSVNIIIGGSLYNSSQPFMLNAGSTMMAITSDNETVVIVVPPGVGNLTVTCNNTEYGRASTTMKATTERTSINVGASVQSRSEAIVTIGAIDITPPDCAGQCNYYNVSYLPSDGSAIAVNKRGPGTMLTYTLQNLMASTEYNVTVVCDGSNVEGSTQFKTNSGTSVNPMMLLMVLSTLIGILMTAQG